MLALSRSVSSFPSAQLSSASGGLPVEVALIAQLGHGAGDQLFESAMLRQRAHEAFVDELDEPSARLGAMDLAKDDPTSLYSFGVGANGHPFHRHAGHRIFTAISGSGGTRLRFSSASSEQLARDPHNFLAALRQIDIPPDSLFTVRFGGDTWHQFLPLNPGAAHPALFALSCHTNELAGALPDALRSKIIANEATIPSLTELLPDPVAESLRKISTQTMQVPTIALSLDAPAGSLQSKFCAAFRAAFGRLRGAIGRWRRAGGFRSSNGNYVVYPLAVPPQDSLLRQQFAERFDHQDTFCLVAPASGLAQRSASEWLAAVLEGFVCNRPLGVSGLMAFRNVLVKPLGLRTSPLGCPASSLLGRSCDALFANRFPVIASAVDADRHAQVILGADDKHLRFRSCVGVEIDASGQVTFSLGTRVQCNNLFGRFYLAAIDAVHRAYVTPAMLRAAVEYAMQ